MAGTGCADMQYSRNPRRSACQSNVPRPQRQVKDSANNRPFGHEQICQDSKIQDGTFTQDHKAAPGSLLGSNSRHKRCFPLSHDIQGVSKVFLFLVQQKNVHVQTNAVRSNHGSLGFHETNESYQEISQKERSQSKLIYRRLHCMGQLPGEGSPAPQVDKTIDKMARPTNQRQEVVIDTSSESYLSRCGSRLAKSHHESPCREGDQTAGLGTFHCTAAEGVKSRSRGTHWPDYIFSLSDPPRKNACESSDNVDEFAQFCGCPSCLGQCYSLSKISLETFLSAQFLRTENLLQDSSPRLGPHDGCFRLWMEWGDPALLCKGFLVGRGSFEVHKREGNDSNSILRAIHAKHVGWQACGNPHRQRGSIFLLKKDGLPALPRTNAACQGVSISVCEKNHYVRGPTHKRDSKCPCGLRIQGQAECCQQLSGPRHFIIWFLSGRLTYGSSGRLMCYSGEYSLQPLCLSLSGLQPKVCRLGCQKSRLEPLRTDLSVPSSPNPGTAPPQDRDVSRKRSINSPLSQWLCIGQPQVSRKARRATSRFLFPFPDDQRRSSQTPNVLQLLDVGIVDIPSTPQPELPAHASPQNLSEASPDPIFQVPAQVPVSPVSRPVVRDMISVMYDHFKNHGCDERTIQFMLQEHKERTKKQYGGAWSRFLAYLRKKDISAVGVKEATVLNYLTSRLGQVKAKTLRTELYGLINPLWAEFGLKIDTTAKYSLTKKYLTAILHQKSSKPDLFPEWDLQHLLNYLKSEVFEPLEDKSLDVCLAKAVILLMLATGRRLEDVSACTTDWQELRTPDGQPYIKFKPFDGWSGKAVRGGNNWEPKDITLFGIEEVEGVDLKPLCPLRAFRCLWNKRKDLGDPEFLWLQSPGSLSRVVIDVLETVIDLEYPAIPAHKRPKTGTHNLRKFAYSFAWKFMPCEDIQQLCDRAGSKSMAVPHLYYIRNVTDVPFYMCTPLGTLKPNMSPIRLAQDPRRG